MLKIIYNGPNKTLEKVINKLEEKRTGGKKEWENNLNCFDISCVSTISFIFTKEMYGKDFYTDPDLKRLFGFEKCEKSKKVPSLLQIEDIISDFNNQDYSFLLLITVIEYMRVVSHMFVPRGKIDVRYIHFLLLSCTY